MPKQLWRIHPPAEADTPVLVMVLLWEVFFTPYAAMKKFKNERMKDNKVPQHTNFGLHTIWKIFSHSRYLGQLKQARASPARKSLVLTQAMGAVSAQTKQRKCSSISPHTTLLHTQRWQWRSLCQYELSSHYRKGGRRQHTLVTLTLSLGLNCCWPAEAAVAFWVRVEELGDRLFWTPNTGKKNIAMGIIGILQCRWYSG